MEPRDVVAGSMIEPRWLDVDTAARRGAPADRQPSAGPDRAWIPPEVTARRLV